MSEDKQREISSKGGKAAHMKGTAHEFNVEEARRAGRLGGEAVSQDRHHMAQIGSRGGQIRGQNAQSRQRTALDGSLSTPLPTFATAEADDRVMSDAISSASTAASAALGVSAR
jgi:general stress protein YciG